jgi:hypothetical protein
MKHIINTLLAFSLLVVASPINAQITNSVIKDGKGDVLDAGWYKLYGDVVMHEYQENDGIDQLWTITNGHICTQGTGLCLAQNRSTLIQSSGGDVFALTPSGGGYTIRHQSGLFVNPASCTGTGCAVGLGGNAYVWTISGGSSGNPGNGSGNPGSSAGTYNDTAPGIVYNVGNNGAGLVTWHYFSGNGDFQGNEHSSNLVAGGGSVFQGASVAIPFNGTAITWIGKKGPGYGVATWSIDGGPEALVNNYSPTVINQSSNVVRSGLSPGAHILRIMLTASTSGYDHWQTVDALRITGGGLLAFGSTAGWNHPSRLVFRGNHWNSGGPNSTDLSNGQWWDGTPGESVSWTFSGKTLITAWGRPDVENGPMNVYIDGAFVKQVSLRYGNADNDSNNSTMIYAGKVSSGQHTITLVVAAGPGRNFLQFDQFAAW